MEKQSPISKTVARLKEASKPRILEQRMKCKTVLLASIHSNDLYLQIGWSSSTLATSFTSKNNLKTTTTRRDVYP